MIKLCSTVIVSNLHSKQELVQQLQRYESEAKGLALQVERLEATNEELNRTIDKLRTMSVSPAADRLGTREGSNCDKFLPSLVIMTIGHLNDS